MKPNGVFRYILFQKQLAIGAFPRDRLDCHALGNNQCRSGQKAGLADMGAQNHVNSVGKAVIGQLDRSQNTTTFGNPNIGDEQFRMCQIGRKMALQKTTLVEDDSGIKRLSTFD